MLLRSAQFAILLVLAATRKLDVDAINKKLDEGDIKLGKGVETRRQRRKSHRSTSSSSGEKEASGGKSGDSGESLGISTESSTSSEEKKKDGTKKKKDHKPKSSAERTGWKKWHRKCTPCPEEMTLKWRDPRIKWICGGYQRARRSFKSLCMMHYRNCQDGTMFTKIFDHRCPADVPGNDRPHGDHFFYDYAVHLPGDSSASSKDTSEASSDSSIFF
ncbi:hypothetical protein ABMA28_008012 [Loxostege sticticalis]|uniref:Uncharacterized protein n=1 Tax=Loxostege sticticalis TaxID=481309 RepID=A0ABD0SFP4_LOXSC